MGMFDWVNHKVDCPECGKEVSGFQTKDTGCDLETVEFWECDIFYTSCDYCDVWIQYIRIKPRPIVPIENYEMTVRKSEVPESRRIRDKDNKIIGYKGSD